MSSCNPCHAGYYCLEGATETFSNECPFRHYCPESTAIPIICKNGTYAQNISGLTRADECTECPAGQYVVAMSQPLYWRFYFELEVLFQVAAQSGC